MRVNGVPPDAPRLGGRNTSRGHGIQPRFTPQREPRGALDARCQLAARPCTRAAKPARRGARAIAPAREEPRAAVRDGGPRGRLAISPRSNGLGCAGRAGPSRPVAGQPGLGGRRYRANARTPVRRGRVRRPGCGRREASEHRREGPCVRRHLVRRSSDGQAGHEAEAGEHRQALARRRCQRAQPEGSPHRAEEGGHGPQLP